MSTATLLPTRYDLDTFVRFIRQYPDLVRLCAQNRVSPLVLFGMLIQEHFGELTDHELTLFGKALRVVAEELGLRHLGIVVEFKVPGCPFGSGSLYG